MILLIDLLSTNLSTGKYQYLEQGISRMPRLCRSQSPAVPTVFSILRLLKNS